MAGAPFSNIRQLANMVGDVQFSSDPAQEPAKIHTIRPRIATTTSDSIIAGYQEGTGLSGTFLEYIWDGATASAIGTECVNVYKFIVENYTSDHEIWLFGFSRGAFTVRCVVGMINNCGIIRRLSSYTPQEVDSLCYEVFRTYRSSLPGDAPQSREIVGERGNADRVWQVERPIRFMGIIDTVGSLGIPRLNAGIGFDWAPFEFFDQRVSSVVQFVWHAPSLHDRLWMFQPCLILPGKGSNRAVVRQMWFPGTHYDVGRQTFRFVRQSPSNWIEKALGLLPDLLSRTIWPNEVLADTVLRWLVQGIQTVDDNSLNPIIPNIPREIQNLTQRIASPPSDSTGSGDIYGNVLEYAPGGLLFRAIHYLSTAVISFLNRIFPRLGDNIRGALGIKTIIGILTATTDRRIPGVEADVYAYTENEMAGDGGVFSVEGQAQMRGLNEYKQKRYVSRTYENWLLWRRVFGGGDGVAN